MYAREVRTDQGMVLAIVAATYFCIKAWKNPKYAFLIFPSIAIGFLFKNVVVFLAIPAILIYCLFYRQWDWVKSIYLWSGLALSLMIIIPWHLLETVRFGWLFWNNYIGQEIFHRMSSTLTGTNGTYDYVLLLVNHYTPWFFVILIETPLILLLSISRRFRKELQPLSLAAPLFVATLIVVVFTVARTHLPTYILPAFPFLAMYIALSFRQLLSLVRKNFLQISLVVTSLLFVGYYSFFSIASALDQVPAVTFEEQAIAQVLKNNAQVPSYTLGWPILETLDYYGDTRVSYIDPSAEKGNALKAPFYLIMEVQNEPFFFRCDRQWKTQRPLLGQPSNLDARRPRPTSAIMARRYVVLEVSSNRAVILL